MPGSRACSVLVVWSDQPCRVGSGTVDVVGLLCASLPVEEFASGVCVSCVLAGLVEYVEERPSQRELRKRTVAARAWLIQAGRCANCLVGADAPFAVGRDDLVERPLIPELGFRIGNGRVLRQVTTRDPPCLDTREVVDVRGHVKVPTCGRPPAGTSPWPLTVDDPCDREQPAIRRPA